MNQPVTQLPSVMARKLEVLQAADAAPVGVVSLPVGAVVTPSPSAETPPATPVAADSVTLTREQYNELQAQSGRLQVTQDRLAELSTRLTELDGAAKATPKPETPAPAVTTIATDSIAFTEQEEQEFGNSRDFISKVARKAAAELLNPILQKLEERMQGVQQQATTAADTAGTVQKNTFLNALRGEVSDLNALIAHKHWKDFCDSEEPISGHSYGALLSYAVQNTKLAQAANIYKTFREKFGATSSSNSFAGVVPSGGAVATPADTAPVTKLKLSDRKKASEDYRKGNSTWEELQAFNKKFEEAEKLGNIDYSS